MDPIEALRKRMAELEHRRADMEQRQANERADGAERYMHRKRRLDIVLLPVHRDQDRASSTEVWGEQMRLRIASLKKAARKGPRPIWKTQNAPNADAR